MRYSRLALTVFCSVVLGGCATLETTIAPTQEFKSIMGNRDVAMSQLATVSSCCRDVASLPFQDIQPGATKLIPIDGSSPVYTFSEGKSHFAAFRLPVNSGDLRITVEGLIDKSLFNPTVLMLDSKFNVTRKLGSDVFKYEPARMLQGDRMEAVFTVDRSYVGNPNNESYMVIYTDQSGLDKTTTILSPSKLMTKSLGVVDYGEKDPVIPHSPWGVVSLSVEDLSGVKTESNYYKPVYQDVIDANTPVVNTVPNKLVVPLATAGAVKSAAPMLTETEAFYQSQIEKAVKAGDIDKAMQLVSEAERAGSTKAKSIFIDADKRSQKG